MGSTCAEVKEEVSILAAEPLSVLARLPRRLLRIGAPLLMLLAASTACRTAVIRDLVDAPLPLATGQEATEDVDEAIWRAGRKCGWKVERVRPGTLRATWRKRHHIAVVSITHARHRFSIRYESSENLLQEGDRIHRNYNIAVRRLAERIQRESITPSGPTE